MIECTYKCKKCEKLFKKEFNSGKPDFTAECPECGDKASRFYGKVTLTKEDENVSGALQLMLYSRKPSQD